MVKISEELPTLESVSLHFADWRHQRRHLREAIPDSLWFEVASLLDRYSVAAIARELKLKPQQMREKTECLIPDAPKFIGVSLPRASDSLNISGIELVHSNGLTLKLHGVSDKQFDHLITRFIASC